VTTIAGTITEDKIVLSSDSRTSGGWSYKRIDSNMNFGKLVKGPDFILAWSGDCSESTLMELFCKDHSIGSGGKLRVIEWLLEFAEWKEGKCDSGQKISNHYLLGHKSGLYQIQGTAVYEMQGFATAGSGGEFAFTALYLGKSLKKAMEVSCELDPYSDLPIKTLELKLEN